MAKKYICDICKKETGQGGYKIIIDKKNYDSLNIQNIHSWDICHEDDCLEKAYANGLISIKGSDFGEGITIHCRRVVYP